MDVERYLEDVKTREAAAREAKMDNVAAHLIFYAEFRGDIPRLLRIVKRLREALKDVLENGAEDGFGCRCEIGETEPCLEERLDKSLAYDGSEPELGNGGEPTTPEINEDDPRKDR